MVVLAGAGAESAAVFSLKTGSVSTLNSGYKKRPVEKGIISVAVFNLLEGLEIGKFTTLGNSNI